MNSHNAKIAISLGVTSLLTHVTLRLLRSVSPPSYHEIVARHPSVVAAHPSLCAEVNQLANLEQDDKMCELMRILEGIVTLEETKRRGNEFKLSRASSVFLRRVKEMISSTQSWKSDRLFNEKRIALEDTLPTIERQMENILHNFIVDN